jgi:hypothetical protein
MKTWQGLYGMIWIVFIEFLLAMTTHVIDAPILITVHGALGVALVALAFNNFDRVRRSTVAGRVKRTAKSTFQLAVVTAVLGVVLLFPDPLAWKVPLLNLSLFHLILFVHVVNAFAIITQAAAVAIAYDMWEDKEFAQETEPGTVPPNPAMQAAAAKRA